MCDRWRGSIKHASFEACTDTKSTGTLAFKVTFPAVFFPGQRPPSLSRIFLNFWWYHGPLLAGLEKELTPVLSTSRPHSTQMVVHSFICSIIINSACFVPGCRNRPDGGWDEEETGKNPSPHGGLVKCTCPCLYGYK